ncbi:hypothetical protein D3C77_332750 [compost metagenome]
MRDLCYYLSKYTVIGLEESVRLYDASASHFSKAYEKHLNLYQVAQAGFPLCLLQPLQDTAEFSDFANCLKHVLELDNFSVNLLHCEGSWSGYERWTARLYNTLLGIHVGSLSFADLAWVEINTAMGESLCSSYSCLFNLVAQRASDQNIDRHNVHRWIAINVTRLNRSHRVLHELEMRIKDIETDSLVDKKAAYQALLDEAVRAATLNLSNELEVSVPFWLSPTLNIWFEPMSGMFNIQGPDNRSLSMKTLLELGDNAGEVSQALAFYRDVWRVLDEKAV